MNISTQACAALNRALLYLLLPCVLGIGQAARADAIRIDGQWHEDVIVVTGERMHFVLMPGDGSIVNVRASEIEEGDLRVHEEGPDRQALRRKWEDARGDSGETAPSAEPSARPQPLAKPLPPAHDAPRAMPAPGAPRGPAPEGQRSAAAAALSGAHVAVAREESDGHDTGMVRHIRLNDVPLGEALRVMLRPLGLDYADMGSYLFISTPERLRREPLERMETRFYEIRAGQGGSLPKIVVQNPGG